MASDQRDIIRGGVFLENLVTHKNAQKVASHIYHMLTSVGVIRTDILSIVVDKSQGLALVHLRTIDTEEFVVKVFSDIRYVLNFFDVRKLCACPKKLNVTRRIVTVLGERPYSNSMELGESTQTVNNAIVAVPLDKSQEGADHLPIDQEGQSQPDDPPNEMGPSQSTSSCKYEFGPLVEEENDRFDMRSCSTSTFAVPKEVLDNECDETSDVIMVDVKTSTPQCSPCFCPETVFYHQKQHIGSESRHAEFKRGGIITDLRSFRSLVGKYLCAFLNTEGGTIYFGVTDDGKALGIIVDQKSEDQIRLMIDNAVSMIKPNVPTTAYSVNFAKIMNENGQIEENLRVLEICVKPCNTPRIKHSFDSNIYVRRDGSLRTI